MDHADRAGRRQPVHDALPIPTEAAALVSADDQADADLRDLAERHHEVLLVRVARLVKALEESDATPDEQLAVRVLLADLALVAASFRQRSSAVLHALDTSARHLSEATLAAAVFERSSDRIGT